MNQDQTLQDILEIVQFLKNNMVSEERFEERTSEIKDEIMNQVDGFIGLHQKLDTELTALRSKYDRLEAHVQQLAKHLHLELQ